MTAAADIVIKKADGTTNITWTLLNAAGGDKSPAVWRSNSATGTAGQRPGMTVSSKWNDAQTVRRVDVRVNFPSVYTDTSSSLTQIRSTANLTVSVAVPQDMLDVDMTEFCAQAPNLVDSALLKACFLAGYAPV